MFVMVKLAQWLWLLNKNNFMFVIVKLAHSGYGHKHRHNINVYGHKLHTSYISKIMVKNMQNRGEVIHKFKKRLINLHLAALNSGLDTLSLKQLFHTEFLNKDESMKRNRSKFIISAVITIFITCIISVSANCILSTRCLLPSHFFVWEATRPLTDCSYCTNVTGPIILMDVTRNIFMKYAYTSKPIIVKSAINNWKAAKVFSFTMLKRLYEETAGSFESIEESCQFLNFKTDMYSLREVFEMQDARAKNEPGQKPWYVGWGNCHPQILKTLRQYYSIPEFLPEDAEFPATENIFFGYEIGAVMHLDYIPRLMWQGQVKGNKTWSVAPVYECEQLCSKFDFYVEPGDIVFLDTRLWYHATKIQKGQFSLTVQSEYG